MEIVYLVVPTLNDCDAEFETWRAGSRSELGPDCPVHFSRFHPVYLLKNLPPTPVQTLERAKAIADAEGLHYVYIGNVPGHPAENTYCPKCRRLVIERAGFTVERAPAQGQVPVLPASRSRACGSGARWADDEPCIAADCGGLHALVCLQWRQGPAAGEKQAVRPGGGGSILSGRSRRTEQDGGWISGSKPQVPPGQMNRGRVGCSPRRLPRFRSRRGVQLCTAEGSQVSPRGGDRALALRGFPFSPFMTATPTSLPWARSRRQGFCREPGEEDPSIKLSGRGHTVSGQRRTSTRSKSSFRSCSACWGIPTGSHHHGRSELRSQPRARRGAGQVGAGNRHAHRRQLRPFALSSYDEA